MNTPSLGALWHRYEADCRRAFLAGYHAGVRQGRLDRADAPPPVGSTAAPALAAWWRQLPQWAFTYQVRGQGAQELHRSWRDHLLMQDRPVAPHRLTWETLDDQDRVLCDAIVLDLIQHFVAWVCADIEQQEAAATDV